MRGTHALYRRPRVNKVVCSIPARLDLALFYYIPNMKSISHEHVMEPIAMTYRQFSLADFLSDCNGEIPYDTAGASSMLGT